MQYLLLIYENEQRYSTLSQEALGAEVGEYRNFGTQFKPAILGGNALQPTSTASTVRVRDGKSLITDGPFAETKECLAGFYLIEAVDLDDAIQIAARIPRAHVGSIEIRPIRELTSTSGGHRRL